MRTITRSTKKIASFMQVYCLLICVVSIFFSCNRREAEDETERDPDVDYFAIRNMHYGTVPQEVKDAIEKRFAYDEMQQQEQALKTGAVSAWQLIGPANIGGRITDLEMPKSNENIIYAGCASGGIFASIDFGTTWTPIFDKQPYIAIGDIEIDPNNDSTVYAGTGEPNTGGGSITYDGNGVYKSTNQGRTWKHIGLDSVGTIGRIAVAKTNSSVVYVAAVGDIYQKSVNKGLYKSTNGGTSWTKVLYISDSTSVNDVAVSPVDQNTLYATTWERISRPDVRVYGGITSNLWKSTDGGTTWVKLFTDDANRGKLTIGIPPTNAGLLYVSMANKDGTFRALYKYNGTTFTNISNGVSGATTYTWWFGGIKCHPTNENIVYYSDFNLFRTTNGGTSWQTVAASSHVDQHAVCISAANNQKVVIGNDGGVYTSTNALSSLTFRSLPNTQVYDFDLYKADEKSLSAAFQDNSFARTSTQALSTWQAFGGGDGVEIRVNPNDKTETYSTQYGALNITTNGISSSDRFNWRCPIRLDPVTPTIRYMGTNKVYKFNPSQNKWTAISGDLTNGSGSGNFGTITTLAVAPSNNNYIYSGSDDGQVYVTKNGGTSWQKITTGLPVLWAMFVKTDRTNPEIAYVGFSGYRYGFTDADIYKTTNAGTTWTRISNDLPQVPVDDLEIDPTDPNTLYLATDIGVYYSTNGGTNWLKLGTKMPSVVVSTLNFAVNTRYLYASTYGRSIYKIAVPATSFAANNSVAQNNVTVNKITVYPNPASDYAIIKLAENKSGVIIQLYNNAGNVLMQQKMEANIFEKRINLQHVKAGNYMLTCSDGKNVITAQVNVVK